MMIRRHADGSEGFVYELGDVVCVMATIHGGWFNHAVGWQGPVVGFNGRDGRHAARRPDESHYTTMMDVKEKPDWGPARCMPWQVQPTIETYAAAQVILA